MMRVFSKNPINQFLKDPQIKKGLSVPTENRFITGKRNYCYKFKNGFVLFSWFEWGYMASCGFVKGTKDSFKHCKAAINAFVEAQKPKALAATISEENKPMRFLINALGFEYLQNLPGKEELRLYEYGGA